MRWLIGIAASLLPACSRERYREQWLADLRDAPEVGLRASGVVVGAFLFLATIDRSAPEMSGMPVSNYAVRTARWGMAFIATSFVLGASAFVYGHGGMFANGVPEGAAGQFWSITFPLGVIAAIACLAIGLALLVRAMVYVPRTMIRGAIASMIAGVGALVVGCVSGFAVLPIAGGMSLMLLSGALGMIAATSTPVRRPRAEPASPRFRRRITTVGVVFVLVVTCVGALDLLVLSPLANLNYSSVVELYAMEAASSTVAKVALWAVFSAVTAIAVLVLLLRRRGSDPRRAVAVTLLVVGTALVLRFFAGLWTGLQGGEVSLAWYALDIVRASVFVGAVVLTVAPRPVHRATRTAAVLV